MISWRRMVAVVALAWKTDAMVPAARVRLNAIAAKTNQALLAANDPNAGAVIVGIHQTAALFRRRTLGPDKPTPPAPAVGAGGGLISYALASRG